MTDEKLQQGINAVSAYIRLDVASGFIEVDQIVPGALKILAEEYDIDELRPHAERILHDAVQEQLRKQADWPAVTDCDRFDAAFARLEEAGVICRHNFSCCQTCAAGEIWDEIEAEREKGRQITGCAHYNCQDMEGAVEGNGVCLSYGSVHDDEQLSVDIGHLIVRAMQAEGLKVTWDGSLDRRIRVALDWKRRLPGTDQSVP